VDVSRASRGARVLIAGRRYSDAVKQFQPYDNAYRSLSPPCGVTCCN